MCAVISPQETADSELMKDLLNTAVLLLNVGLSDMSDFITLDVSLDYIHFGTFFSA